jgi:toxin-antitoxin system PIN domain toxin
LSRPEVTAHWATSSTTPCDESSPNREVDPDPGNGSSFPWMVDPGCSLGSTWTTRSPSPPPSTTTLRSVLLPDVNVFVYAFRSDTPRHDDYRQWLEAKLSGHEPIGVSEAVLSSLIRVTTNHRIFREPSTLTRSISFCTEVLDAPGAVALRPGTRNWELFTTLCEGGGAIGNLVPDAYLAALALEHGATLVSTDRGMRRWPGLAIRHPLDDD